MLLFFMWKERIYILLMFQKINNSNSEKQIVLLTIPNWERREAKSGDGDDGIILQWKDY